MVGLTTTIMAATVYPDWVRLSRQGKVRLEKGTQTIEIFGLPGNLHPDTLRATIYGSDNPRLLGVRLKPIHDTEQLFKLTGQLEHEIEGVEEELKQLTDKAELVRQNRGILDKIASQTDTYASALASGTISAEKQIDVLIQLRSQTQKLDEEARSIQLSIHNKEQQKEKLTSELEKSRNIIPQKTFTAIIDVEILVDGEITIEVSYVIGGVSWQPIYDLRLLEKGKEPSLEVSYLANICQETGENWENISLTLSSARPVLGSQLPDLDPWLLEFSKSTVHRDQLLNPSHEDGNTPVSERSLDDLLSSESKPPEELSDTRIKVNTAVTYLINNAVSIPSDNFQHPIQIARFFLVPRLEYQATPKLSQAVYRQAYLENDSHFTLLPGIANIIVGDEYIGSLDFELVVPGEKFEIFLGNENRLKVDRELKRREVDKRMLWGKRHIVLGYQIKIESMLHKKAVITINDQIPLPTHEDIKVKLDSSNINVAEQNKLNQLVWNVVVEPKETRVINFEFSIEAPPGKELMGL